LSFVDELRHRNVFRVAATYLIAGWLIIQVVSAVSGPLNLPDWFDTVVIVLLAIGFPIAALFAWAFELTPDGIRASRHEVIGKNDRASNKLDYALIGALFIVAGTIAWNQIGARRVGTTASYASIPQDKSIAVLSFADMSAEGDQGYFADGIAEELLNALTRLDGLRVASRTSSFSFRGSDADIRAIGEALNVNLVLEGSVRKDGDRIRITAQLIDTANGYHHWVQTYDRNLNDIFAIQDEIANAIAGVLGVSLGVGNVNSFRGAGTDNFEAYEAYWQAKNTPIFTVDRIRAFERAVQIDPDYAAALAELGLSIASMMWVSQPEEAPDILDRALPILLNAIELRPDSAYAYTLLASVNYARLDWNQSEQYYNKALAVSRDGEILAHYGNMLMRSGRSEAAIRAYAEAAVAERYPVSGGTLFQNAYLAMDRFAEVDEYASQHFVNTNFWLLLELNRGDLSAIEAALTSAPRDLVETSELFVPLLEVIESPDEALDLLRSVYANTDIVWPSKYHDIALLAAYYGDPEFSLDVFSREVRLTTIRFGALWYPVMSGVRKLPAFRELMSDINLLEYWRINGWSNHCRPLKEEDFECF
jgi:TolB-like protein/tetratricopeptide (TPR) repeat protein